MRQIFKTIWVSVAFLLVVFLMGGCGFSDYSSLDPEEIVPKRVDLIKNLEDSGYTITTHTTVEGSDLIIDRVIAQKESRFIDIVYGLTAEDADKIFDLYCELYPSNYYILARNGNYVYCVSDKKAFSKAGFTSTTNIGVQYIHD